MAFRSVLVALLGIAVAGGSAYGARQYMIAQAPKPVDLTAELVSVVVATQNIDFGTSLNAGMLSYQTWPRVAVPVGAFTSIDDLARSDAEPRRAKYAMAAGIPILASEVSNWGEKVTLVQNLSPDTRAMAIKVDAETAVGGFVTPGDHVDVLLTQGGSDSLRTVTILQGIRVLGVDQDANQQSDAPVVARTVTVEVTPEDTQKLALAQKAGALSLVLRTQGPVTDKPLGYTTLADVLQDTPPPPQPEPVAVPRHTVTVRKGNTDVEIIDVTN